MKKHDKTRNTLGTGMKVGTTFAYTFAIAVNSAGKYIRQSQVSKQTSEIARQHTPRVMVFSSLKIMLCGNKKALYPCATYIFHKSFMGPLDVKALGDLWLTRSTTKADSKSLWQSWQSCRRLMTDRQRVAQLRTALTWQNALRRIWLKTCCHTRHQEGHTVHWRNGYISLWIAQQFAWGIFHITKEKGSMRFQEK